MFCKNCGKEIDDNAAVCIHCGVATGKTAGIEEKKINGFGIAGFVIALLSLWLGVYFCIASILALIFSAVALMKMKSCRLNGLAIAGFVISIISLLIWGLIWLIVGAAIISMV